MLHLGSEVQICVDVAKALGASGTRTRVVSMPCWSLFEDQGEAYQLEGEKISSLKAKATHRGGPFYVRTSSTY